MHLSLDQRIISFSRLGDVLSCLPECKESNTPFYFKTDWQAEYLKIKTISTEINQWFTSEFIDHALLSIAQSLSEAKIRKWLSNYSYCEISGDKRIGVIMAGNIPLVGFHDFISVLISGNYFIGKVSSKEGGLIEMIAKILIDIEPHFKNFISFSSSEPNHIDGLIATGSNNTARYFKYGYKNIPSIIRKNRNSISILTGEESNTELQALANDIFLYFGLGCRNISKLIVPLNYNFNPLISALDKYNSFTLHKGYMNNYLYQSAIHKTENIKVIDNGYLILKEAFEISSPIGVLYYQYFKNDKEIKEILDVQAEKIQCITSKKELGNIPFGKTQFPDLWDYSDNVDTINFLHLLLK